MVNLYQFICYIQITRRMLNYLYFAVSLEFSWHHKNDFLHISIQIWNLFRYSKKRRKNTRSFRKLQIVKTAMFQTKKKNKTKLHIRKNFFINISIISCFHYSYKSCFPYWMGHMLCLEIELYAFESIKLCQIRLVNFMIIAQSQLLFLIVLSRIWDIFFSFRFTVSFISIVLC